MKIVMFYHSLISDWNHGNAHFLRGMVTELLSRGHDVDVYEPQNAWSVRMLKRSCGEHFLEQFHSAYPVLDSIQYDPESLNLDETFDGADLVIVHEWNEPGLVNRIGSHRSRNSHYRLLFHDTHHRSLSVPDQIERFDLTHYDGVLAFGEVIRQIYLDRGWTANAWTWHEAADVRVFKPVDSHKELDVVWIGNWGDEERAREISDYLLGPVQSLGLDASVFGVRYPARALKSIKQAGIKYEGWIANFFVPDVFARAKATVHIPRRYYTRNLPGIPTIRPFEAMACGIPLVCSPWNDSENLFRPGVDYLLARNSDEMKMHLREIVNDSDLAQALSRNGLETILSRHTCGHRADELMQVCGQLGIPEQKLESEIQFTG